MEHIKAIETFPLLANYTPEKWAGDAPLQASVSQLRKAKLADAEFYISQNPLEKRLERMNSGRRSAYSKEFNPFGTALKAFQNVLELPDHEIKSISEILNTKDNWRWFRAKNLEQATKFSHAIPHLYDIYLAALDAVENKKLNEYKQVLNARLENFQEELPADVFSEAAEKVIPSGVKFFDQYVKFPVLTVEPFSELSHPGNFFKQNVYNHETVRFIRVPDVPYSTNLETEDGYFLFNGKITGSPNNGAFMLEQELVSLASKNISPEIIEQDTLYQFGLKRVENLLVCDYISPIPEE